MMSENDIEVVASMVFQAYTRPLQVVMANLSATPLEEMRVLVDRRRILAVARVVRVGQFFGGRSIPCADIRSVAVVPEARRRGLLGILMLNMLTEMRQQGAALSLLTPSSVSAYRKQGYEQAGAWTRFSAPISAFPFRKDEGLESWGPEDLEDVMACYQDAGIRTNGLIDRSERWWREFVLHEHAAQQQYRYLVRREGRVTGYLVFTQKPVPADIPYYHTIDCRDLVWADEEAGRSILSFVSGDRVLGTDIEWSGPINEPLSMLLTDEAIRPTMQRLWMTRLVDVEAALAARGYGPHVETDLDIAVSDDVLPENSLHLRLSISGGKAKVTQGQASPVRLDVRTLAAIYTSWMEPRQALRAGRIKGATADQVAALEAIFAGPKPWVMDLA